MVGSSSHHGQYTVLGGVELLYNSVVYTQQSIRSGFRARIQLYSDPNKPKVKLKENRCNKHVLIELIDWS